MTEKELKIRTRRFAIDVLNFIDLLPNRKSANIIANQLGRSASAVAAITEPLAGQEATMNLLQKLVLLKKSQTNLLFGLIYCRKQKMLTE